MGLSTKFSSENKRIFSVLSVINSRPKPVCVEHLVCLSRIRIFPSRIQGQKGNASATKNLRIFYPKNCSYALGNMIRDVYLGSGFFPSPDPGFWCQKAVNLGSGSATLTKIHQIQDSRGQKAVNPGSGCTYATVAKIHQISNPGLEKCLEFSM